MSILDSILGALEDVLKEAKDIPTENLAIIAVTTIGIAAIFKNSDSEKISSDW
ncbi:MULTISPECIES: hypothetical protein [Nitrosomonas]|mgnify:CR=1 FL=1|uniref:hypothetical protein n=1 Tax=Nitrosomonas TaxID=914 RepID=UPI00089CEEA9|nr:MULTISPECIES: hypothetical protein [Nitrosomonas]SDW01410.1 hypothetical protein SAMN05216310_101166 [Nitrosomonas europaea]SES65201.1 hypothetical protein SAMN05216309_101167 [Nitrosomonas europaea]SJZ29790.1 hypothetical protein SAMN02745113_00021 [Nitrosomonas europaea]